MTRREFLAMAGMLGLGTLATPTVMSAKQPRKVIVIGAGAAGLTAAYRLHQRGIEFQILEASNRVGGRMKHNVAFTDFPLAMGAEWLHTSPDVFDELVADPKVDIALQTVGYRPKDTYAVWDGDVLTRSPMGHEDDRKFVNSGWLTFFERYILPTVADHIRFQDPVREIDTTGAGVLVRTQSGQEYSADEVIVTVSLKMLQERRISFRPDLPRWKTKAIESAVFWEGYKAFLEFDDAFYPSYTDVKVTPETAGQHSFYDAAYGQNTNHHILGVFAVGSAARQYLGLSKSAAADRILRQLDEIFDGAATPSFRKIVTQDWSNEPYVGGAYVQDYESWQRINQLGRSAGAHLHFAGEAYTDGNDWGGVHAAALAAKNVVDRM